MAAIDGKRRWNCPSDRELTLRAKLNSGWSVHSQDYFQKPEPILMPEVRSIENVIERAHRIELLEKERIEKLVCRLENMKRNAVGDRKGTCSMCGIAHGLFRTSFSNCTDCFMAVCEKCRIDIYNSSQEICVLCKICAENREVWKKSGGWFYGHVLPASEIPEKEKCNQNGSPNCGFNTWEHRKPDIVRLESFEPPEENHNENPLYKNWAVNSSPDLSSLDENVDFLEARADKVRKYSESGSNLEMYHLSPSDETVSKLSVSCPSLQEPEADVPQYKQAEVHVKRQRHVFSRKKFLKPARKVMEKITKHRKT